MQVISFLIKFDGTWGRKQLQTPLHSRNEDSFLCLIDFLIWISQRIHTFFQMTYNDDYKIVIWNYIGCGWLHIEFGFWSLCMVGCMLLASPFLFFSFFPKYIPRVSAGYFYVTLDRTVTPYLVMFLSPVKRYLIVISQECSPSSTGNLATKITPTTVWFPIAVP